MEVDDIIKALAPEPNSTAGVTETCKCDKEALAEKAELDRTYVSGIERGLFVILFGDLIFDRADDPLIHVCDLLSFVTVTAFFADERIIREIFVAQVNCGIRPRLSPTSQSVDCTCPRSTLSSLK